MLTEYPDIKMNLHFSGCLLEWIEKKRPELLLMVRDLAKRSQVEILSGGFYEPILTVIPYRDAIGQIEMQNRYIEDRFAAKPRGAWISERVWEPSLAEILSEAGMKYAILDDAHFTYAGIKKEDTYAYYITEDKGHKLFVFPSDKILRYHIPFKMPWESVQYMKKISRGDENCIFVYGDDAEKFGEWPGTFKWVYEAKWLRMFFDEIVKNSAWLKTETFSGCIESIPHRGRVYFPTGSYEEMLEWALPADVQEAYEKLTEEMREKNLECRYKPYLRGGFWRNFLVKYPEANHMHKRMLYVSGRLDGTLKSSRAGSEKYEPAVKDLYRGQCNCAYWHGVFGGLYFYHLRESVYKHLIKAESAAIPPARYPEAEVLDLDADGYDEIILRNKEITLFFSPAEGGVLKELDSKLFCHNFTNTLTRRKEAYHRHIIDKIENGKTRSIFECRTIHDILEAPDKSMRDHLIYDRYGRYNMVDHFLGMNVGFEDFVFLSYKEEFDLPGKPYEGHIKEKGDKITLTLKRLSEAFGNVVDVTKEISIDGSGSCFIVRFLVTNMGDRTLEMFFGSEFNFTMPSADSAGSFVATDCDGPVRSLGDKFEQNDVRDIKLNDPRTGAVAGFCLSHPARLWYFPIKTVSQTERAYELAYQSSVIFPAWKISLKAAETFEVIVKVAIDRALGAKNS